MGGPSGSSGTPSNSGGQAVAYQPTAQPQADTGYQSLLGGFFGGLGPSFQGTFGGSPNMFSGTPGATAYSQLQPFVGGAGSGTITDPNNPLYLQALAGAQGAAGGSPPLLSLASLLTGGIPGALGQSTQAAGNTYGVLTGAQSEIAPYLQAEAPSYMTQSATTAQNLGNLINQLQGSNYGASTIVPQQAFQEGQNIANITAGNLGPFTSQAQTDAFNLNNYGNSVLNTAFDPQNALYNQLQNQVAQQAAAANASAGLGGSAYGASTTANALGNFNINWQNQQLARQAQGLSAAEPAYSEAAQLPFVPSNAASSLYGAANQLPFSALQSSGTIGTGLANLQNLASGLPANTANAFTNANAALGNLGTTAAALPYAPISGASSTASAAAPLYSTGGTLAGLPYNTQSTNTNNVLSALSGATNIGNQQFEIPQQLANDLQSYLQLGQSASNLSGQLGALGQQELGSSLSGIGSALGTGSNLLFGNQGLSGALGLGSSGLLGSLGGGGAAAGIGGGIAGTGALDVGGGGELASGLATSATGAADAGAAGGFSLGSLLPFGAS